MASPARRRWASRHSREVRSGSSWSPDPAPRRSSRPARRPRPSPASRAWPVAWRIGFGDRTGSPRRPRRGSRPAAPRARPRSPGALVQFDDAAGRLRRITQRIQAIGPEVDQACRSSVPAPRWRFPPFEVAGIAFTKTAGRHAQERQRTGLHCSRRSTGPRTGRQISNQVQRRWPRRRSAAAFLRRFGAEPSRPTPTLCVDQLGPDGRGRFPMAACTRTVSTSATTRARRAPTGASSMAPSSSGGADFAARLPFLQQIVPLLPARRAGHTTSPLGRRRRLPLRLSSSTTSRRSQRRRAGRSFRLLGFSIDGAELFTLQFKSS